MEVILVDKNDDPIGVMEKMAAHEQGLLHRAISVFIVRTNGNWLIHQRANNKYHSAGLWTNASCSHPVSGESSLEAANRRLREEMGIKTDLKEVFSFIYKAELDQGLTEHELDHVFIGISDDIPHPNTKEVADWKEVNYQELDRDVQDYPGNYTVWFKIIYQRVQEYILSVK